MAELFYYYGLLILNFYIMVTFWYIVVLLGLLVLFMCLSKMAYKKSHGFSWKNKKTTARIHYFGKKQILRKEYFFHNIDYVNINRDFIRKDVSESVMLHYLWFELLDQRIEDFEKVYLEFFGKKIPREFVVCSNGNLMRYNIDTKECQYLKEDDKNLFLVVCAEE